MVPLGRSFPAYDIRGMPIAKGFPDKYATGTLVELRQLFGRRKTYMHRWVFVLRGADTGSGRAYFSYVVWVAIPCFCMSCQWAFFFTADWDNSL